MIKTRGGRVRVNGFLNKMTSLMIPMLTTMKRGGGGRLVEWWVSRGQRQKAGGGGGQTRLGHCSCQVEQEEQVEEATRRQVLQPFHFPPGWPDCPVMRN